MIPDFILSIAANLATDLLKWGGEELLSKRKIGAVLRVRLGLLNKDTEDQYRKIVTETYAAYFHNHPERQLQDIYDFFRKDIVSKRLYEYIFDGIPIDYGQLENELRLQIGNDYILWRILKRGNLTLEKLISDFFSTYEERERSVTGLSTLRITRRLSEMEQRLTELVKSKPETPLTLSLFELESPPLTPGFVARKAEIQEYQRRLKKGFVAIDGMAGVGKTWVGAQIAKRQREVSCFWFTFRPGLRDTLEALLWELSVFLAIHDEPELWQMLQDQRSYPLNVKVGQLVQSFSKHRFLLCLDDFQVVQNDQQINSFFAELRNRLSATRPSTTNVIIIGFEKPKFMADDDSPPLQGLSKRDMDEWLDHTPLQISKPLRKELWEKTAGNAKFISLFVQWATAQPRTASAIREFINQLPERSEIAGYILTRISETLTPDEQTIVQSISQFRGPVSADTLGCVLAMQGLVSLLRRMARRHLLEIRADGKYFLHSILHGFYKASFDPHNLASFHRIVAECFVREGDFIEASYHFIKGNSAEKAVEILSANITILVNTGRAQSALELLERISTSDITPHWRANAALAKGRAYRMVGKFQHSATAFEEAESEFRRLGDKSKQAEALCGLAETRRMQGDYDATLSAYRLASDISKEAGDSKNRGIALCGIGRVLRLTSNYYGALEVYEQANTVYQEYADEYGRAETAWGRARTLVMLGRHKEALEGYKQAEELARSASDTYRQAEALFGLAEMYRIFGQYDLAIATCKKGKVLVDRLGTPYGRAWMYIALAETYRSMGMTEQAMKLHEKAQKICEDIGDKYGIATTTLGLAEIARVTHDLEKALLLAEKALDIATSISHRLETTHCMLSILESRRLSDRETLEEYDSISKAYQELGCQWGVIHSLVGRALAVLKRDGDPSSELNRAISLAPADNWPIEQSLLQRILARRDPQEVHLLIFP